MPYTFSPIAELPKVREQALLPALTCTLGTRLVTFPENAPDLKPVIFPTRPWDVPRFSLFHADVTLLSGFRLHEVNGRLFTDSSIVGDSGKESELFNRQVQAGQAEDLNRQSSEAPLLVERDGGILVLASSEPSNFGSWIYRFLPKYLLSRNAADVEAVLVYTPRFGLDLLGAAGFPYELIPHNPRRRHLVTRAVVPSLPAPHVYFRSEVMDALRAVVPSRPADANLGERLYVSRRMQSIRRPGFRVLIDETELVECLREYGFAEFVPEDYELPEQMAIFSRARVIIGCGGSNMFGCVFARNVEFIVDLESGTDWIFAHLNLFESLGCSYSAALGTRLRPVAETPHINWTIDVPAVMAGLTKLGVL